MIETGQRASSHLMVSAVMANMVNADCVVGVHHVCHDIGHHVSYGILFRLALKFADILLQYLNKTSAAVKHTADESGKCPGTSCVQRSQTVDAIKLSTCVLLINYGCLFNNMAVNSTDFTESYTLR